MGTRLLFSIQNSQFSISLSAHQLLVLRDMLSDISLYLTRVISLPDYSTRLRDAVEELELEDKAALGALLECWTTVELIASTDSERASLKEITDTLTAVRTIVENLAASA